jgi:mono/diheme cytochrome c family protein
VSAKLAQSLGWAVIVAAALVGATLAVGLYQWEAAARSYRVDPRSGFSRDAGALTASAPIPTKEPPLGKVVEVRPGAAAFRFSCDDCHPSGGAGRGPALAGASAEWVARIVRDGSVEMPSYTPAQISDSDLADLVTFVNSLR